MVHAEPFEDQAADHGQKLVKIGNRRRLSGNGIDGFKLLGPAALQLVKAGILQGYGGLGGEQCKQVNHARIKVVELVTLEIEYADHLIPHHKWYCYF